MEHPALGRTRGKTIANLSGLDRLHAFRPSWKLHWFPVTSSPEEPRWVLANHASHFGIDFYQSTGQYRLTRLEAQARSAGQELGLMEAHGSQLMMDGGLIIGFYRDEELFTDAWWYHIQEEAALPRIPPEKVDHAEQDVLWNNVSAEVRDSEPYRRYWADRVKHDPKAKAAVERLNDEAREAVGFYMRGRVSAIGVGADFT